MPEKKRNDDKARSLPPIRYYIAKELGGGEMVFRVDGDKPKPKPRFLQLTWDREDSLHAILRDQFAPVYVIDSVRTLVESLLGEAEWRYGDDSTGYDYEFGTEATRLYPEPPEQEIGELPGEGAHAARPATPGTVFDDYCQIHKRKKHKDGHAPAGKGRPPRRKYQCPDCKSGRPPITAAPAAGVQEPNRTAPTRTHDAKGKLPECYLDYCMKHKRPKAINTMNSRGQTYRCSICVRENKGRPRGGRRAKSGGGFSVARKTAMALKLKNNLKCATCGEHLRRGKTHKRKDGRTSQYWKKCVNGCAYTGQESEQQFNRLSVEELLPIVDKVLARHNGHDPQDRSDIRQSIALDLHRGVLKPADLHDRDRIRRYIDEQKRFSTDGHRTVDLDAPVGDDSKMTYADAKPAPAADCDPHQQLEAKEALESRLRGQPTSLPNEFIAPVVGDTHDSIGDEE